MPFFSSNLRKIREAANLSQAKLAAILTSEYNIEASDSNVFTWERGTRPNSERVVEAIADIGNVSKVELMNKDLNIDYLLNKKKEDKTVVNLNKTVEYLLEELNSLRKSQDLARDVASLKVWVKAMFLQLLELRGIEDKVGEAHKILDEVLQGTFLEDRGGSNSNT